MLRRLDGCWDWVRLPAGRRGSVGDAHGCDAIQGHTQPIGGTGRQIETIAIAPISYCNCKRTTAVSYADSRATGKPRMGS